MSSRRHSVDRPSLRRESRWFGQIARVRANQKPDNPVKTRPLSGISVGSTTSNVEIRSLATSNRRSSSSANNSRIFPLPTWTAASGIDRLLLRGERVQALERRIDVTDGGVEIENCVEIDPCSELGIRGDELTEVAFLFPRLHRVTLDRAVGLLAR